MTRTIEIPTLADEARDHDQLEGAAATLAALYPGSETVDAEMGEWLIQATPDGVTRIEVRIV